jgi:L-amino acid N-acyltransferase YncA
LSAVVRLARAADVNTIVEIARRGWREGFAGVISPAVIPDPGEMATVIGGYVSKQARPVTVAVGEQEGEPRGYITFGPARDEDAEPNTAEVYALFVDPPHWRQGIGRSLVSHALSQLASSGFSEAILWTLADTPRSRRFYEALGFTSDGATQRREMTGGALEVRYRIALR